MLKSILIKAIKGLLWILDPDHRQHDAIIDDVKKFTHVVPMDFESDFGRCRKAFRTVPYDIWVLRTASHALTAADRHRVIRDDGSPAWLEDLKTGDMIRTEMGPEAVIECRSLGVRAHTYCLEIETEDSADPNNHLYYSDGILSHNTTCAGGYLLWKAMFTEDATILIVAQGYNGALEIVNRIRYAYENTPNFLKPGAVDYNKGNITFDNRSRIISRATSADATRGLSISLLYADEFAFVRNSIQEEFWAAVSPTLSTGGSCIITSTPKSDEDKFADLWRGATDNTDEFGNPTFQKTGSNGFYPVRVTWESHPDRDDAWAEKERKKIGEARFRQEHCCEFVSDDQTLIDPVFLSQMTYIEPEFYVGTTRWFKDPDLGYSYLVGLDPSSGTGGDYASIQVFELPGMTQVAEWKSNRTPVKGQVETLKDILHYIEDVVGYQPNGGRSEIYWTVENNSLGLASLEVIEHTGEEKFPGILVNERKRKGQARVKIKGLNTNPATKRAALIKLKSLIETERMKINSRELLKELKTFIASEGSAKAKPGCHDDLVMAAMLCVRLIQTVGVYGDEFEELHEIIRDDDFGPSDPLPIIV